MLIPSTVSLCAYLTNDQMIDGMKPMKMGSWYVRYQLKSSIPRESVLYAVAISFPRNNSIILNYICLIFFCSSF